MGGELLDGGLGALAASALVIGSGLGAWLGTGVVLRYTLRAGVLDRPDHRSLHQAPTPRGGGLAVAAAFVAAGGVLSLVTGVDPVPILAVVCASGLVTALGWVEDSRGLTIGARLVAQVAVAAGFIAVLGWPTTLEVFGADITLGPMGAGAALLWLVWLTNLYNFMDGADGVAGGQTVVAGAWFGLWFWLAGGFVPAVLCWCLAAAGAGFLRWNWAPAKIFLGDAGSLMLGFTFGALALVGVVHYGLPWSAFALGLGLFVADATWTLIGRMLRGEPWWLPHRSHYYQRALATGWSDRRVASAIVLAGVALGGLGTLEALRLEPRWIWAALAAAILLGLAGAVLVRERSGSTRERVSASPPSERARGNPGRPGRPGGSRRRP